MRENPGFGVIPNPSKGDCDAAMKFREKYFGALI
jgi:hypothetical protein